MGRLLATTKINGGCFLFHRKRVVKKTSVTEYSECVDCMSRFIKQECGVYQPVDWDFLKVTAPPN